MQKTVFSDTNDKNGFFITSVDENVNSANQQADKETSEQSKPMFEEINAKSKYGTFSNGARRIKKQNKLVYKNGRLTRIQNSYAQLKTNSKLPSVSKGTKGGYLHTNGAQTQRGTLPRHNSQSYRKTNFDEFSTDKPNEWE